MTHYSHCDFHLGDNLIHLHFLRKLAARYPDERFVHAVHLCHTAQLREAIEDIPAIQLDNIEELQKADGARCRLIASQTLGFDHIESRDVWKNAGGYWQGHRLKNNYSGFYIEWFRRLAGLMGLESPFNLPGDLLFDYPAILDPERGAANANLRGPDFLLINSQPCSGQCRAYDRVEYFDPLIETLLKKNYRIAITQKSALQTIAHEGPLPEGAEGGTLYCTGDHGLSITGVGNLSLRCKHLIMVSTGPSWPTFNIWRKESNGLRIVLLDNERLNLTPETIQCQRLEDVFDILRAACLI